MPKFLISVFFGALFTPTAVYSLTMADYQDMYKNSQYFHDADDEMALAWKNANLSLSAKDKRLLLQQQREWLKNGRDEEAKDLMDKGFSKECAYARVAKRRAGTLKVFSYNAKLSKEEKEAGHFMADDYYYHEDDDIVPEECKR